MQIDDRKIVQAALRKAPKFWRETADAERHVRSMLGAALATLPSPAGAEAMEELREIRAALEANAPFAFDPATGFLHADDGGAGDHCVFYVPKEYAVPQAVQAVTEPVAYQQRELKRGEWSDWYPSNKEAYEEQQAAPRLEYDVRALVPVGSALAAPASMPEGRFDLVAHLNRQRAFSIKTFGPGTRTRGVVDHIRKELAEIEADPTDIKEWVDVILLAFDGAWRAGWEPQAVVEAIDAIQTRNEGRTWPDWRTADPDKAIEHVRAEDA